MRKAFALALLAAGLAGCANSRPQPRLPDCPGPLRSVSEIAGDFVRQERIRVRGGGVDESFGLVLQKKGARLVVLGFTPFGAKAFSLIQRELEVESESYLGRLLLVPPENVLRDLHRAYFLTSAQSEASERRLARGEAGMLQVASAACGYEATLASAAHGEPGARTQPSSSSRLPSSSQFRSAVAPAFRSRFRATPPRF